MAPETSAPRAAPGSPLPVPPSPGAPTAASASSAPMLPTPSGPGAPAVVPDPAAPAHPLTTLQAPQGHGSVATEGMPVISKRAERYGSPVAPVGRAAGAVVAAAGSLLAATWMMWSAWERRSLMVDVRDGLPIGFDTVDAADDRLVAAGVAFGISTIVTGVALIVWMHRAYKNAGAWRPITYGVGWAILSWFVPILNLLRPAQIMSEIVEATPRAGRNSALVVWWWLAFLGSGVAMAAVWNIDPATADEFVLYDTLSIAVLAVVVAATVMLMMIVGRTTNDQRSYLATNAATAPETATVATTM